MYGVANKLPEMSKVIEELKICGLKLEKCST